MKAREKSVFAKINNEGRLMTPPDLREFLTMWKNNRVVVRFEILPDTPSEALKGYYFHYVVPTMKTALWESGQRMNEKECEEWMRRFSPITFTTEFFEGKWHDMMKRIDELSNAELVEHIEHWKLVAAETYGVYIDDPQTITKNL